ncbi:MAG: VOC family protein [Phormidesmis sp.]
MKLNPSLSFNGQCAAAFKFYEQCLDGKPGAMMTWGESPVADEVAPELRNKVMHTSLRVGDVELMGSDSSSAHYQTPQGFSVCLNIDDPTEAERAFQALAENGTIKMPMEKTFWAARFGMLVDQFNIPWMINCDQPT